MEIARAQMNVISTCVSAVLRARCLIPTRTHAAGYVFFEYSSLFTCSGCTLYMPPEIYTATSSNLETNGSLETNGAPYTEVATRPYMAEVTTRKRLNCRFLHLLLSSSSSNSLPQTWYNRLPWFSHKTALFSSVHDL